MTIRICVQCHECAVFTRGKAICKRCDPTAIYDGRKRVMGRHEALEFTAKRARTQEQAAIEAIEDRQAAEVAALERIATLPAALRTCVVDGIEFDIVWDGHGPLPSAAW